MKPSCKILIGVLMIALLPADSAQAESEWGLGVGAVVRNEIYRGADADVIPFPVVYYRGERFLFTGKRAGVKLSGGGEFDLFILADLRFDGYDEDDGDFLTGMDERRMTLDAGLGMEFGAGYGEAELEAVADLLDRHGGYELRLGWKKPYRRGRLAIEPRMGANYLSEDLAGYYYGVKPEEALDVRPRYEPGDAVNWNISLTARYRVYKRLMLAGTAAAEFPGDEIKDSPIVDEHRIDSAFLSLIYRF